MEYYGAPPDVCLRVSELLGFAIDEMGEDWEMILADASLILPAIRILEEQEEPWMVRAAIGCILVQCLFEYRRDEGVNSELHERASSVLRADQKVLDAVRDFWIGGGVRSVYIKELLLS